MKKLTSPSNFKIVMLFILIIFSALLNGQNSKSISREAIIPESKIIKLSFDMFDVEVVPVNNQTLKLDYNLNVTGDDNEVKAFYGEIERQLNQKLGSINSGEVDVSIDFEQISMNGSKTKVKFAGNRKEYKLGKLSGSIKVELPIKNKAEINSSFNKINIGALRQDLTLKVNSSKVVLVSCGNLTLDADFIDKFEIGTVNILEGSLNSCSGIIESVQGDVALKASFSNFEVGTIGGDAELDLNSGSFETSDVSQLTFKGDFLRTAKFGNVKEAFLKLNSTNIAFGNVGKMNIDKASFSGIDANAVVDLNVENSSSSKFKIGTAGMVNVDKSGFSSFNVKILQKGFKTEAQSGDFTFEEVTSGFETIEINGSFLTAKLNINSNANYTLDANLSFPNYKFENIQYDFQDKDMSKTKLSGWSGKKSDKMSKVKFECNSCNLRIN